MLKQRAALLAATSTIVLVLAMPFAAAQQAAQAAEQPTGPTKPVTWEDIRNDQQTTGDVVSYGLGPRAQRYSPLDKINMETVKDLVPAWSFSFGGEKQRGQEAQPLVHDGTIFVTGSYSRLWAIDARTGKELWEYVHRLPGDILPCCDVINRGPALYDDLVIFGTLDAQLLAFDQKTGKRRWKEKIADYKDAYTFSAAPLIVNDMVVTGLSGGEFGVVGEVQARDAKTGKSLWTRPTIEGFVGTFGGKESTMTGERNKTWEGDSWRHGGGAPWNGGTYDPETNLIYMGVGNPSPWNAHGRPGANLYTSSTLALNPENGEIVWHFQYTPHDTWDFDGTNEFIPFDYEENGRTVKAGGHADRNGFFYVLDRTNGKFLRAFPFVRKITWAERIDENGKPVETGNRPGNPADLQQTGGVQKGEAVFTAPSFLGAKNWNPIAYNPDTGLFYVPSNEWGMDIWNEPISYKKGVAFLGAVFTIKSLYEDHVGVLRAVDPKTGNIVWEHENPAPLWSGVLGTKGGLVFAGTPEGFLKAFDAKTGQELWSFQTGSGVVGSPITWEMDGEQYVAVVSGWGGAVPIWGGEIARFVKDLNQGGSLWVFKLHKPSARAGQ